MSSTVFLGKTLFPILYKFPQTDNIFSRLLSALLQTCRADGEKVEGVEDDEDGEENEEDPAAPPARHVCTANRPQ